MRSVGLLSGMVSIPGLAREEGLELTRNSCVFLLGRLSVVA
jgi:hypothetical protein